MKKIIILFIILFFSSFVLAETFNNPSNSFNYNSNSQFINPSFNNYYSPSDIDTYWPGLRENIAQDKCTDGTDFLMMIPPAGCSPAVVRSDLLTEQNVPVFCKIQVAQVNPLIKVSSISSMSFKGKYPNEIAGVSYHPSKAALRSYNTLLGSPVINNAGYVVLVLKKQKNESSSPKFVYGNLTATISYDAEKAFGTGQSEYYLETMDEEEWAANWGDNSFWQGKGYLRLVDVQGGRATVELLSNEDQVINRVTLKEGETSGKIYFPGSYCSAAIKVKLNSVVSDEDKVLLNVDGDNVWVRKGSKFLNGRCTVTSLELFGPETGKVKISCGGKPLELSLLSSMRANLTIDSAEKTYDISDFVLDDKLQESGPEYSWYVGHVGVMEKSIEGSPRVEKNTPYVVLLAAEKGRVISSKDYISLASKIKNTFDKNVPNNEEAFVRAITPNGFNGKIKILFEKDAAFDEKLLFSSLFDSKQILASEEIEEAKQQLINAYFKDADNSVKELIENYPLSRDTFSSYGEQGILAEIELIDDLKSVGIDHGDRKTELLNKFLELYPESPSLFLVKDKLNRDKTFDTTNAYSTIYVNNDYHSISVVEFKESDKSTKKVELYIDEKFQGVHLEEDTLPLDATLGDKLVIRKVNPRNIQVDFYSYGEKTNNEPSVKTINIPFRDSKSGEVEYYDIVKNKDKSYRVQISDIDVKEVAYVSLIPEVKTKSEANLTFNIGIEQREFALNPEKAKEKVDELNKTIKEWEDRNAQLGDLVEKWKGVCLATGAALQVKSLLSGFTGKSLARQEVMNSYEKYCSSNATNDQGKEYRGMSRDQCYNSLSKDINSDVEIYTKAIQHVNMQVKDNENVSLWTASNSPTKNIVLNSQATIQVNDLETWEEVRAYLLMDYIGSSEATQRLKDDVKAESLNVLMSVAQRNQADQGVVSLRNSLPDQFKDAAIVLEENSKKPYTINNYQTISVAELKSKITHSDKNPGLNTFLNAPENQNKQVGIAVTQDGSVSKLIIISGIGSVSSPSIVGVYDLELISPNFVISGKEDSSLRQKISVSSIAGKKCAYPFSNPVAKFYDTEPNKGMASIVPFNLEEGWYVYVTQSQGGILSSNVQGYQESGAVKFYYICNVGSNGREEKSKGDDICQSFNINNYDQVQAFNGCSLSKAEITRLASRAEEALKEAARQYSKGSREITIFGNKMPAEPTDGNSDDLYQCQDFMSPDECKLMYNVCDPVICPSSRCDFGGQYPVSNVVQSGIAGSLTLCSKNFVGFGGDVYVPVCLTGLHAGIDGFISILKAQQSCMAEYVKTGKHTGICDEMTAVYKCEFFWRQTAPLLQNIIPNLAESLYSGGEKGFGKNSGGGEYLTFQTAWDNMQKGIDYFKNTYAQTSFRAAKFGDIEEIGVEYCRNFIGTSVPASGKALDNLLKPESPPQFYAQFSEIKLTQATVPATSQYKVFYHIFAGKEEGASYSVYLKNPPSTSYYYSAQTRLVKTGYVQVGEQASESIDFSAPEGYKELCVVINNQEECGFKSVTSDFGLDYLHDSYTKDQAQNEDIKTEKECIAGTPSILAGANLNPQAGLEEGITPDISLRGIVRVCATQNPGQGVNSYNWKEVGYCNDQKMKCWLDENSVKKDALNIVAGTDSLAEAKQLLEEKINTDDFAWSEEQTREKINELKNNIDKINLDKDSTSEKIGTLTKSSVDLANELEVRAYLDSHKAEALLLEFRIYEKVMRQLTGKLGSEKLATVVQPTQDVIAKVEQEVVSEENPIKDVQSIPTNLAGKIETVSLIINDNLGEQVKGTTLSQSNVITDVPFGFDIFVSIEHSCSSVQLKQERTVLKVLPWFSKDLSKNSGGEVSIGKISQDEKRSYSLECYVDNKLRSKFNFVLVANQNLLPSAELR